MTVVENKRWTEDKYLGMVQDASSSEESRSRCKAPIIVKPFDPAAIEGVNPDHRDKGKPAYYAVLEWAEIKVAGDAPKLAGWSLLARVEGFEGGNLLHC